MNTERIQQLIQQSKDDSANAKTQRDYLINLLTSSNKLDSTQNYAIKKSAELNSYFKNELGGQRKQNDRLLNPIEIFSINYRLSIPANQPDILKYREGILN